jgi:hypothetical protein
MEIDRIIAFINKHRVALVLILVVLATGVIVAIQFTKEATKYDNVFGESVYIDELQSNFNNISDYQKDVINNTVFELVQKNSGDASQQLIGVIREGTKTYTYSSDTNIYRGDFVVDIESVRQSYSVRFEWSSDPDNPNLSAYGVVVTCVSSGQMIYQDFAGCVDNFPELHTPQDPLLALVPSQNDYYKMYVDYATPAKGKEFSVVVNIKLAKSDYNTDINTNLYRYEQMAIDYLSSNGIDVAAYNLIFTNTYNLSPAHR